MTRTLDSSSKTHPGRRPSAEALGWRRRIQVASVGTTVATITVFGSLILISGQESSAATQLNVAAVPMGVGAVATPALNQHGNMPGMDMSGSAPTPTMAGDIPGMDHGSGSSTEPTISGLMPGMDHGASDSHGSAPIPTMSGDMPGMDHGASDSHGTSPSPTMDSNMPGMDHASEHSRGSSPSPTMDNNMPGMDHGHGATAEVAVDRPLVPVLGTFGGGASAVMLSAAFLRRRDRAADLLKVAARAARWSGK